MVKVIHLSDFHLENSHLTNTKASIIKALAEDMKRYVDESTLLFFTGDLIDKGGASFEDKTAAFDSFENLFIKPILQSNPSLVGRIFIVPGNHDVFRDKIDDITEVGLKSNLKTSKSVDEFIIKNRYSDKHLERIADYKEWESRFYSSYGNKATSYFDNSFRLNVGGLQVGVSCFNSAWLCKDNADKENLLLGGNQVTNSLDFIRDCDVKMALMHHPLEFLSEFDREVVRVELYKSYNALFTGHVHELASSYTQDLYGNIFVSIANSTIGDSPKERKFSNGYTVVEIIPNQKIRTIYRKFIETHSKFVPNTEIGTEDGTKEWQILKDETLSKFEALASIVEGIGNRNIDKFNDDFIVSATSTNAACSIDNMFVEPTVLNYPQRSTDEEERIAYTIESILSSRTNFLIHGLKESGKTIFLDKIFIEAVRRYNQFGKIPIYLKFGMFKEKNIETVLKNFIGLKQEDIEKLLGENDSVLMVDDLAFSDKAEHQLSKLKALVQKYPKMQLVATTDQTIEHAVPTDYLPHNDILKFDVGFIQNLNSTQIKELIGKWFLGKEIDFQGNMERLMKSFVDFGLPKTPLSVTMFLWIFEQQEKKPLNNSVLVELFVENLLEKTNLENIYSGTFDFKNKQRLLSFIAKFMRDKGDADLSYAVNYVDLLKFSDDYLKTRFTGKPQKVLDDLIRRGVLCYEDDNLVRFKSAFFFHYFLALHLDYSPKFKKEVFTGETYLDYTEEIIYYTGLKRDDADILNFTQLKLQEAFGEFNEDVKENFKKVDDVLEIKEKSHTIAFRVPTDVVAQKPTEEKLNEAYDNQLSSIPVQKNIPKKDGSSLTKRDTIKVLKLATNVLKNSEDVDDFQEKVKAYQTILTSTISSMMQERDYLLSYYNEFKCKPEHLPKNIDFNIFIRVLPLIYQVVIYNWLGTQKLKPVITAKIDKDISADDLSEFERYLSIFIYSDIRGIDYPEKIATFIKNNQHNYLKDLSFLKIISYYHLRNNTPELDKKYLDMLYGIKKDLGQVTKQGRHEFVKNIEQLKSDKSK